MEQLIIQYPKQLLLIWILLSLLHNLLYYLCMKLYKDIYDYGPQFQFKYDKKSFLKLLLWLVFGIAWLAGCRQAMLSDQMTKYQYFAWVGAFFFLIIVFLIRDFLTLIAYFAYRNGKIKLSYSFKASLIIYLVELFVYSALLFLSFFITKNPFLLGGAFALAVAGAAFFLRLTELKKHSKFE